jgi:festuclavine dehydrogenase
MAVLLTGGTGKTSREIIKHLVASSQPFLIASRRGANGAPEASLEKNMLKFDYTDESSWDVLFQKEKIKSLYIVMPEATDPVRVVNKFVDLAHSKGGKQFL